MKRFIEKNPKTSWVSLVIFILSSVVGNVYNTTSSIEQNKKYEQMYIDFKELQTLLLATDVIKFRTDANVSAPPYYYSKDSGSFNWAMIKLEDNVCKYATRKSWDNVDGVFDNFPRVVVDTDGIWYIKKTKESERVVYFGPVKDRKATDWKVFLCEKKENTT